MIARGPALWCLALLSMLTTMPDAFAQGERIGRVQQPLVNGQLVDEALQQQLGLVTVGGGCSGTLINRFWVLTADHCVSNDGMVGGPDDTLANNAVSAAWSTRTVTPSRIVRWGPNRSIDIAMLFLGAGDFGPAPIQLIAVGPVDTSQRFTIFGRGIMQFARGTGPGDAVASVRDALYRSTVLVPVEAGETAIEFAAGAGGQSTAGGDSGGPVFVNGPGDMPLSIAGLNSFCSDVERIPGMPQTGWNWVTSVGNCTAVAIEQIRSDIIDA